MTTPENVRYYTPKLGLLAPSVDDELTAQRPNWDRLDKVYSGGIIVNAGTIPDDSTLFDGCIVAERNTGIIWRAQRNESGAFEKRYIKYPWRFQATGTGGVANGNPGVWLPWGYTDVQPWSFNSSTADIVSGRLVIPVTGIYRGSDFFKWNDGAGTGARSHTLWINDTNGTATPDNGSYEYLGTPNNVVNSVLATNIPFCRKFNKGDTLCAGVWQNSGTASINVNHELTIELVRATW